MEEWYRIPPKELMPRRIEVALAAQGVLTIKTLQVSASFIVLVTCM